MGVKGHRTQTGSKPGELTADDFWRVRILLCKTVKPSFPVATAGILN